jgi:hypothetical protein
MTTFVFFHYGDDQLAPFLLVQSIRTLTQGAFVIQCSDRQSIKISGVDAFCQFDGDLTEPMYMRMISWRDLRLSEPAIYLDADMLLVRELDSAPILAGDDAGLCRREFDRDWRVNPHELVPEYSGKRLDEVWPYVGCFTAASSYSFWAECADRYERLDAKFRRWWGDQEVLREIASANKFSIRELPESVYACLPDRVASVTTKPRCLHFKGAERKDLMLEWAGRLNLL